MTFTEDNILKTLVIARVIPHIKEFASVADAEKGYSSPSLSVIASAMTGQEEDFDAVNAIEAEISVLKRAQNQIERIQAENNKS